jgi:hypothetical protein
VAPWRQKFSRLNVLFICYGIAVEHRSLLNRSGICDGINTCIYIYIYIHYIMYIYITNLVCYTYFHWFFSPECQHIFGKQTGYIFQSPKKIKTWTTKHYAICIVCMTKLEAFSWRLFYYMELWHSRWNFSYRT